MGFISVKPICQNSNLSCYFDVCGSGKHRSVDPDEITAACRRLARTFHPDHNASPRATAEMQVVNTVRKVLTDPDTRALYDRERVRFHASRGRVAFRAPTAVPFAPVYSLPGPPSPIGAPGAGRSSWPTTTRSARRVGLRSSPEPDPP